MRRPHRWAAALAIALAACSSDADHGDLADAFVPGSVIPDARIDAYDSCHFDCFGYVECLDGVAIAHPGIPVPCDQWQGACPVWATYTFPARKRRSHRA